MKKTGLQVKIGRSLKHDPIAAVKEVHDAVNQQDANLLLFFCSSKYDLDELGRRIDGSFAGPVVGCTTAGELSPDGYQTDGIVAATLSSSDITVHVRRIFPLSDTGAFDFRELAKDLRNKTSKGVFDRQRMFGLLLIDGLSKLEDAVIASLSQILEGIPIVGGSAGDDINFQRTFVFDNGEFISDAAVFVLFETDLPFTVFKTQHFIPTDIKIVVTGADARNRIIYEINGLPAASEYARILDLSLADLNADVFSEFPLMIRIGGDYYVRSIQQVNPDGSLSLFCAIEEGLVLTIGKSGDITDNLTGMVQNVLEKSRGNDFAIFCDCILRRQEVFHKGLQEKMNDVFSPLNMIGFSTYGEQYNAIHVNQTLTGVIIHG